MAIAAQGRYNERGGGRNLSEIIRFAPSAHQTGSRAMFKRITAAAVVCLALVLSGCKVWESTKSIPGKTAHGISNAFTGICRASERSYDWRRTKISPDSTYDIEDEEGLNEWIAANLENKEYLGDLPYEVKTGIARKHLKHVDLLQEFVPNAYDKRVVMKSDDEAWQGEVFCALNEGGKIVLEIEGPKAIFILGMLGISRDRALTNVRKYIYKITDEQGAERYVPAPTTRAKGLWFYHTRAESGSMPHVFVLDVPEGRHTYTLEFLFNSGEGDILLKFLEPYDD